MIVASTLSTIEAIIPYLILAGVVVFIALRVGVLPLVDLLQSRKRKHDHTE